jgi:hypothetical protein
MKGEGGAALGATVSPGPHRCSHSHGRHHRTIAPEFGLPRPSPQSRLRGRQVFEIEPLLKRNIWPGSPKEPRPDERAMERIKPNYTPKFVAGKKIMRPFLLAYRSATGDDDPKVAQKGRRCRQRNYLKLGVAACVGHFKPMKARLRIKASSLLLNALPRGGVVPLLPRDKRHGGRDPRGANQVGD